ncbi:hypothetical protein ABH14_11490 [Brevibacillus brevis]|uniref:pentapeptide repeat-containing protein n=1 Tax=Brevibacillus brevis TaxID=1393 RepID=UPI0019012FFA|nr:pentapeptide repeat-containing protein [Brevibacillus brevis]MBH0330408.1 hypothetical protein [Brevibacillus brevis]
MKKEEALQHLHDNTFLPALAESVAALERYFQQNKDELVREFVESFRQMLQHIEFMQNNQELPPVGFIHFSLLRTTVLDGTHTFLIEAYTEQWYWEPVECYARYDAAWALQEASKLISLLDERRKMYMGIIQATDVEFMVLKEMELFGQFVTALARVAIPEAIQLPEYQQIRKADRLYIRVGEFKDISEVVYVEERIKREEKESRSLLGQPKGTFCTHETFAHMDLPRSNVDALDLRYCDFSGSNFADSQFCACILFGTRWVSSKLPRTDFSHSLLCDADFRHADLSGAIFSYAEGQGVSADELHRVPGLLGVQFAYADLQGADFRYSRLYQANFHGANMRNAVFLEKDRERFALSEAQMQQIEWRTE